MREQGLDGTGTIKGSAQGFIQDYEMGGGGQDGSRMILACETCVCLLGGPGSIPTTPKEILNSDCF